MCIRTYQELSVRIATNEHSALYRLSLSNHHTDSNSNYTRLAITKCISIAILQFLFSFPFHIHYCVPPRIDEISYELRAHEHHKSVDP